LPITTDDCLHDDLTHLKEACGIHRRRSSPNPPVPINKHGGQQLVLSRRCKSAAVNVALSSLPQSVAILPTPLPNGRSRHTVKVFYQVQVAVREVCDEAQNS
jgi:hypothetical protein